MFGPGYASSTTWIACATFCVLACDYGHAERATNASSDDVETSLSADDEIVYRITFVAEGASTDPSSGDGDIVVDAWDIPDGGGVVLSLRCDEPLADMESHELPDSHFPDDGAILDASLHRATVPFSVDCTYALRRMNAVQVSVQWHVDASLVWESTEDVELSVDVEEL